MKLIGGVAGWITGIGNLLGRKDHSESFTENLLFVLLFVLLWIGAILAWVAETGELCRQIRREITWASVASLFVWLIFGVLAVGIGCLLSMVGWLARWGMSDSFP